MRDAFAGYDAWLEAPYQQMCTEADNYMDWCDEFDMDPDHEQSEIEYAEYLDSVYDGEMSDYDAYEPELEEDWYV